MDRHFFSDEELHKLTVYRIWLFLGFPVITILLFVLAAVIGVYVLHVEGETMTGLLCFVGLLLPPFTFIYCLSKYKETVRKTAYNLMVKSLNLTKCRPEVISGAELEKNLKNFGIFAENGYIWQHHVLQGQKEGIAFSLSDISWITTSRSAYGSEGYNAVLAPAIKANKQTKAQYTVLSVIPGYLINCKVLLKRHKLFKWGIKNLKQIQLPNQEFEKLYDTYTDQPEQAAALLNPAFTQALVEYIKSHKKHPEFIITPQQIYALYNTGIWKKLFSLIIFRSPRVQCDKVLKETTDILHLLPTISLLANSQL